MNPSPFVASGLQPRQRQDLAVKVLSKKSKISHLAHEEGVSRKFLYQQKDIAIEALNTALEKSERENEVLYYLPVTHSWIFQLILKQLSDKFLEVKQAVEQAMKSTPRASSLVENLKASIGYAGETPASLSLNSRLRNYFFLRKHLGSDYLELLRFFLNHRTFRESRVPERVGKSPTELMTGKKHPHSLEMLGFELFQRA